MGRVGARRLVGGAGMGGMACGMPAAAHSRRDAGLRGGGGKTFNLPRGSKISRNIGTSEGLDKWQSASGSRGAAQKRPIKGSGHRLTQLG